MLRWFTISLLAVFGWLFFSNGSAQAQDDGYAYTYLLDWPSALTELPVSEYRDTRYPYDLLPFIDSLALGYAFGEESGQPWMDFQLMWTPGAYGVLDNQVVPIDRLPGDVRIVAVDLRADVFVGEEPVATLHIALDSLQLGATPDVFRFERTDSAWSTLFVDIAAAEARAYVDAGFTLRNLSIDRIAFASFEAEEQDEDYVPGYPSYPPPSVGVYPPDVIIWVDWIYRPGAGKRAEDPDRRTPREGIGRAIPSENARPRTRDGKTVDGSDDGESQVTRTRTGDRDDTATTREGRKKRPRNSGDKKDDDDDDDSELWPAALAGVAAVGVLAYAAGTVGYFGNTEAPIGLSSGYVSPRGGALLQVAVNEAVLGSDGEEKLVAKATVFYNVLHMPIYPALGVGVVAKEPGGDIELSPSLSLGVVGNLGLLVLYGGYDLAMEGVDLGVAFNFRHKP